MANQNDRVEVEIKAFANAEFKLTELPTLEEKSVKGLMASQSVLFRLEQDDKPLFIILNKAPRGKNGKDIQGPRAFIPGEPGEGRANSVPVKDLSFLYEATPLRVDLVAKEFDDAQESTLEVEGVIASTINLHFPGTIVSRISNRLVIALAGRLNGLYHKSLSNRNSAFAELEELVDKDQAAAEILRGRVGFTQGGVLFETNKDVFVAPIGEYFRRDLEENRKLQQSESLIQRAQAVDVEALLQKAAANFAKNHNLGKVIPETVEYDSESWVTASLSKNFVIVQDVIPVNAE
jgi:hypothetical protein